VILFLSACASAKKSEKSSIDASGTQNSASTPAPSEVFGPFPSNGEFVGPLPQSERIENPDRIAVVFGKGLAHGYAYVGVLKALQELKIPVQAIYAKELGALVGALYLTQPNSNRIDWALLRFNEKNLAPTTGDFAFRMSSPARDLEEKLREVFGDRRLEEIADRIHIDLQDAKTTEFFEPRTGDVWRVLRASLAGANRYSSVDVEGRSARASARSLFDDFRRARQTEKYPILVVSAGGAPLSEFLSNGGDPNFRYVHVPLAGIDDLDLKKRNQAVFSGKGAILKAAPEILGLVGRKPE